MSNNYNSFSPNAIIVNGNVIPDDVQRIQLYEGDQLQSLKINIKESICPNTDWDTVDLIEWPDFSLDDIDRLTFYFGEIGAENTIFSANCFIANEVKGIAYFQFPAGVLDDLEGDYIGYIKAFFEDGRTVTIENKILFNVLLSHDFLN